MSQAGTESKPAKGFQHDYSQLIHTNPSHKKYVVVNWCLLNTCNYKCSYCPEFLHSGSLPWPEFETVKNFCDRAIKHYKGRNLYIEFTGGEVTLWKDLPRVAEYLKSRDVRIGIISNGSRSLKFWNEFIQHLDHVCLSYHPESGRVDHFYKIVELCHDKIRTHVNLMMHPDYFDDCLELGYKVKDLPDISIAVQPLVVDMEKDLYSYTEEQRNIINTENAKLSSLVKYKKRHEYYRGSMTMVDDLGKKVEMSPQRFISAEKNKWKGWYCSAGVEQIVVDVDGEVYRGWCRVGSSLGNIKDKFLYLPRFQVLCSKSQCHCNLDIMSTKNEDPTSSYSWIGTKLEAEYYRRKDDRRKKKIEQEKKEKEQQAQI